MVQIWYMDRVDQGADPRLPHHIFPPKVVALDRLAKVTQAKYYKVNVAPSGAGDAKSHMKRKVDQIKRERKYDAHESIWTFGEKLYADFVMKNKELFETIRRDDFETGRLVLEGGLYLDIQDKYKSWIRILLEPGDFISVPTSVPHRLSLNLQNYVKCIRYSNKDTVNKNTDNIENITSLGQTNKIISKTG